MYPFTLLADLSSLTIPLTVMRQVMGAESPWARRSAKSVGSSVVNVCDYGNDTSSTR